MKRYIRNMNTLSPEENASLKDRRVAVVGCGGLGGYVLEMLGRLGIGYLTAIDGDVFEESNLNRQLLSDVKSLGMSKAIRARQRLQEVNPLIKVQAVNQLLSPDNARELLAGHQVIVDAVDSAPARLLVQDTCEKLNIPMVHGAIGGWYGQVATIFPGDRILNLLYSNGREGVEKEQGNPSFTPALIAAIQVSEVVKVLIGRGNLLRHQLLYIDLLHQEYELLALEVGD
ncbi:HesA/MoeB/ThiF family protein [Syntrophomonas erecta]